MAQLPGIGVFGTGTAVKCLVSVLKANGFDIPALWGRTKEAAKQCGEELGVKFTTCKVDDVLLHKDVDLVFLICPPHWQATIAQKTLGIGKHVICGMPCGTSQAEVLNVIEAAEYYPTLMSLMCNGLRFLPCYIKMRQLIENGYIGDCNIIEVRVQCGSFLKSKYDWMCDELMGGGILNFHGSVIIDLITFLTGQKAVKVNGLLKTFTKQTDKINGIRHINSDDFCTFQMELDSLHVVTATVNLNSHIPGEFVQEVLVCGTNGYLVIKGLDLFGKKITSSEEECLHKDKINVKDENFYHFYEKNANEEAQKNGNDEAQSVLPLPHLKGLIKLVESVKEAFMSIEERHGWTKDAVTLGQTLKDTLYVQAVIEAIRRSSKERQWVKVVVNAKKPDII